MLSFLAAIILTELLTELIVKSVLFRPLRAKIKGINDWFHELFSCGYCMSVWVSAGVVFTIGTSYDFTGISVVDVGLTALIVHRLSNYLHNFNDKFLDKYYDSRFVNTEKSE
jgi:hypothetical protein